ncbi:MAG TPA: DUF423 domain-containing protein [Stellaceae bacterium]|nr:DUF423 domain-containing protein [Stellaceae bacterium]
MRRLWLVLAGLGGLLSVAAGAYAAHGGLGAQAAEWLHTGSLYGMVHAAALLAVTAAAERRGRLGLALAIAGSAFAAGIVLFSFSLFALALTGIRAFARVTPFGGAALMIGWATLAIRALFHR